MNFVFYIRSIEDSFLTDPTKCSTDRDLPDEQKSSQDNLRQNYLSQIHIFIPGVDDLWGFIFKSMQKPFGTCQK